MPESVIQAVTFPFSIENSFPFAYWVFSFLIFPIYMKFQLKIIIFLEENIMPIWYLFFMNWIFLAASVEGSSVGMFNPYPGNSRFSFSHCQALH